MTRLTRFLVVGCLAVCTVAGAQTATAPTPAATLSEVQRLRAENLRLRFALWQQQRETIEREGTRLQDEAKTIEAEFRKTLGALPAQTFNWTTLSFDGVAPTGGAAPSSSPSPPE